jgi:Flp pilus assembly protein TadB
MILPVQSGPQWRPNLAYLPSALFLSYLMWTRHGLVVAVLCATLGICLGLVLELRARRRRKTND